jgi:hypothetical protein
VASWRLRAAMLRVLRVHMGIFNSLVPKKKFRMNIYWFALFLSFSAREAKLTTIILLGWSGRRVFGRGSASKRGS